MKRVLSAIGRALAALPRFVWERVCVAGEWVSRLIALPAAEVVENESVGHQEPDEYLSSMRAVAACIASNKVPSPELVSQLSDEHLDWLLACNVQMLKKMVRADDAALKAHVQNRRPIKGVLVNDPETVALYTRDQGETPDVEYGTALKHL